ncbi:MAG: Ig-like domain-containing protein, partial [Methanosarcinales archaeon]|nr:Ig-like domain-containing protein [Methanosarcinales archaeon]
SMVNVSGWGQNGTVGTELLQPFVFQVKDVWGNPVPDVVVNFTNTSGSSINRGNGTTTNSSGQVNVTLTLGTDAAITYSVTCIVANNQSINATISAEANANVSANMSIDDGNDQIGSKGTNLTYPCVFKVVDEYGNPVSGEGVTFVANSTASCYPTSGTTDSSGLVNTTMKLGSTAGAYSVTCNVTNNPSINATINATAVNLTINKFGYDHTGLTTERNNTARVGVETFLNFSMNATNPGGDANLTSLNITFPTGFILPAGLNDSANMNLTGFNDNITALNVTLIGTNVLRITNSTAGGCIWNTTTSDYFSINLTNTSNFTMPVKVRTAACPYLIDVNVTSADDSAVPGGINLIMDHGEAYNVTNVSGMDQTGTVGSTLAKSFVFQVNDIGYNIVPGVAVNFSVHCTGGAVSPSSGITNISGQASTVLALGTTAGNYRVMCNVTADPTKNNSINATATADSLDYINVTPMNASLNVSSGDTKVFTAAGYDQYNNPKSGLNFTWDSSDTYVGTIAWVNDTAGIFTAAHVGTSYITASNGTKTSDSVSVAVNAGSNNTTVTDTKVFAATSGDANITGTFTSNVTGWVNATALGNATASPEVNQSDARDGLGSNLKMVSGVIVNASSNITDEMAAGNGTIRIKICFNDTTLTALDITESTLAIYKYNSTTGWAKQTSTVSGSCVYADVTHLCTFGAFGYKTTTTPSRHYGGGGGSGGTYPPTATPTVTSTATATATATATTATAVKTAKPTGTAKPGTTPAAGEAGAAPKVPKKKGLLPGFEGVFAIAGLLAVAYLVMRKRRT